MLIVEFGKNELSLNSFPYQSFASKASHNTKVVICVTPEVFG